MLIGYCRILLLVWCLWCSAYFFLVCFVFQDLYINLHICRYSIPDVKIKFYLSNHVRVNVMYCNT